MVAVSVEGHDARQHERIPKSFRENIIDRPEMRFNLLKDGPFSLAIGRESGTTKLIPHGRQVAGDPTLSRFTRSRASQRSQRNTIAM